MSIENKLERIENLLEENNIMLRCICAFIIRRENPTYRSQEDLRSFMANLVADWYTDKVLK